MKNFADKVKVLKIIIQKAFNYGASYEYRNIMPK